MMMTPTGRKPQRIQFNLSNLLLFLFAVPSNADVICGGHSASTCADCPQGNGASWCNGACKWESTSSTCVSGTMRKCANGIEVADGCDTCPAGANGCFDSGSECVWIPATGLCRDTFSDSIRTASVQLNYDAPPTVNRPAWLFQRVSPVSFSDATFFATNGHRFGYGGFQKVDSSRESVIFSLWDQGGCDQDLGDCDAANLATTIACGEGITCTGFGGEGTGRKSILYKDNIPSVAEPYYMMTQAVYLGPGSKRMQYTGYFYDSDTERWRLLSRIEVSTNDAEEWWIGGMYSFVEQWSAVDTSTERSALFGPGYVSEDGINFVPIEECSFSHGTLENHEHVNAWQAGEGERYAVGIATGGDVTPVATRGDRFQYQDVAFDNKLQGFIEKISCLGGASGKESIEQCLQISSPAPTPAPTSAPTPAPVSPPTSTCSDSTEPFMALKPGWTAPKEKTCDEWVKRRATGWRCFKVDGVAEACPETCLSCCVDSTTPFNLLFNKKEKTCEWAAINPELRCRKAPTRMKCAQTCGQCD